MLFRSNTEYLGARVCLNRNAGGRFLLTEEQRKQAIEKSLSNGGGFLNMSWQQHMRWASIGGARSAELKKGVHAIPEDQMKKIRARGHQTIRTKYAKTYEFIDPDGKPVTIHNLNDFCRKTGLNSGHMRSVNCGRLKSHRGWRKAEAR